MEKVRQLEFFANQWTGVRFPSWSRNPLQKKVAVFFHIHKYLDEIHLSINSKIYFFRYHNLWICRFTCKSSQVLLHPPNARWELEKGWSSYSQPSSQPFDICKVTKWFLSHLSIVELVHQLLDEVAGEGDEEGVADDGQLGEHLHDGEPDAWFD